ncbi:c-type cytochrome [Sulfurimonas sp.]|uniref:c-type cytochrome n=1 Tax=Sulfurimonas sp. TaxID=2022749 RepID=UPI003D11C504
MKKLLILLVFTLTLFGSSYENGHFLYNAKGCSNCHGTNAEGSNEVPRLANKSKKFLVSKLKGFQAGIATNQNQQIMIGFAQGLSDKELDDITNFLSTYKQSSNKKYKLSEDVMGGY